MAKKLLQLNFKFSVTKAEYEEAASSLCGAFAKVDGLRWIYLFNDESSLDAFLNGPLAEQVKNHPAFSDMTAKPFDVMPGPTATTRGPV